MIAKRVKGIVQLRLPSGEFAEGKSNKRCWNEDLAGCRGSAPAVPHRLISNFMLSYKLVKPLIRSCTQCVNCSVCC